MRLAARIRRVVRCCCSN